MQQLQKTAASCSRDYMRTDRHWQKIGLRSHHGISLPLSALRSKKSCGIGEFHDLISLIDWCSAVGFDCIQLLPLTDMGDDTSPYNPVSSCALDPIFLSLADLPGVDPTSLEVFFPFKELPRVAIREVKHQKIQWLYRYFLETFEPLSHTQAYLDFLKEESWVLPYALFKAFKDEYGGKFWKEWPPEARQFNPHIIESKKSSIDFHSFMQYHCYAQLKHARAYAEAVGIFFKGDVPILISPDSADVWAEPHLFNLELEAGAPPDYYNKLGQKWGFPLFNWEMMKGTKFTWWKRRLKAASHLYPIYRIDHVVGFFRIWAIPKEKSAKEGHFVPADHHKWAQHGQEILEMMIDSSPALPMAEDLGVIPDEVYPILKELGICGTKVLRWQKQNDVYIPYCEYEPFSLTTVSTHDMDTVSGWWKKFPDEAIAFAKFKGWSYHPRLSSEQLLEILKDAHHTASYFHINLLQEYLALFPELVSTNVEEERINIPGQILPNNWTYRFKPSLEELLGHEGLTQAIGNILR